MLRFLGIYPVAIIVALAIATFVTRHQPTASVAKPAPAPLRSYVAAPAAPALGPVTQAIEGDRFGNYVTRVQIDGRELPMVIDTGASYLSLTNEDAGELGIHPAASEFTLRMQTANGVSSAARTWLPHVKVGSVEVHDVEAIVMAPGASRTSLLGMSFLGKLHRFGVADGRMRLEQ
jgi:aspartyl protease family protein